jgi:uncharacterized membrane protein YkvA (DUF1232 family)
LNENSLSQRIKQKIENLKVELLAVWFAYRHPKTPWYAKILVALIGGYAFSPIDLIPDFIPIIGYLDDVLLLPLGIYIAIRLIPKEVLDETRIKAKEWLEQKRENPKNKAAGFLFVFVWILIVFIAINYFLKAFIISLIKSIR